MPQRSNQEILNNLDVQVATLALKMDYLSRDMKVIAQTATDKNDELAKIVATDHQTLHDLGVAWKLVAATAGSVGAAIGVIATLATAYISNVLRSPSK